jgi:hypothetical protein
VDVDGDSLPDDWEQVHFGNLSADPDGLAADGSSLLFTFAFAQQPSALDGNAEPICRLESSASNDWFLAFSYRRREGLVGGISYAVESSDDLHTWSAAAGDFVEPEPPVPLYDGTGTERVTLRQTQPLSLAAPHRAFRVRVSSPQ